MPDDSGGSSQHKKNQTLLTRLFGQKNKEEVQAEAEEEILNLVDKGQEQGIIEPATRHIIENVFDFDDTQVCEIMTHRTEMTAVEDTDTLREVVNTAIESGHSRIPVYHEDIDNIVGVLYVKDLLKYVCDAVPKNFRISSVLRKVIFVPRTKKCSQLFEEMTKSRVQLAIIVDEYGGTDGLITMEDLIEEVLGNIQDEYDKEEDSITVIDENKFTVEGATPIEEIEQITGVTFEEGDFETVAGLLLEKLEHIPSEGERPEIIIDNLKFTIVKIEDRRIVQIEVEVIDSK